MRDVFSMIIVPQKTDFETLVSTLESMRSIHVDDLFSKSSLSQKIWPQISWEAKIYSFSFCSIIIFKTYKVFIFEQYFRIIDDTPVSFLFSKFKKLKLLKKYLQNGLDFRANHFLLILRKSLLAFMSMICSVNHHFPKRSDYRLWETKNLGFSFLFLNYSHTF